jgi:quinolinate synthase
MSEALVKRILELKAARKAVILAHNYQPPEIQEIADMTGDSLELSRKATSTDAEVILFCGVAFMAETAAILNPGKIVLLPRPDAGCPMADMITVEDLLSIKKKHPGLPIITYVNSTAAVKAESTVCCTSANAIRVVESFRDAESVFMAPDQNLAQYASRHTEKQVLHWHGYCPFHHGLSAQEVLQRKGEHPDALFIAHPECRPEVLDLADEIMSTSGMLRFAQESPRASFIVGTEVGILYALQKQNPKKRFYAASQTMLCSTMKLTGLEDVCRSLETLEPKVRVAEDIRLRALEAVERMIRIL